MLYYMVAVYDSGVGAFMRPWFVRSKGEGIRMFTDETRRVGSPESVNTLRQHPGDYALHFLGIFDDGVGRLTCPDMPEKLIDASSVIEE